jgi:Tol biopolymer transport system component
MDWSRDGLSLAVADKNSPEEPFRIVLVTVATGEKRPLTAPPAKTIGDTSPVFSPDGKSISFIRAPSSGVTDLYVMPLAGGEPKRLTFDNRSMLGQAWTADSRAIVFCSNRTGNFYLWRVPVSGGLPERMPGIGENASDPWFSPDGRKLAYSQFSMDANIWRLEWRRAGSAPRKLISSTQYDSSPQYSPDGARVAFRSNRSGNHDIWVADSAGENAFRLTNFGGPLTGTPRWSPDSRRVAFDTRPAGQADIYIIEARAGAVPRRLTAETSEDVVPSWSLEGRWVYFASNRGGVWQVWKAPSDGGPAVQVTTKGGFAAFESPDRKYLYYAKGRGLAGLWRVLLEGGEEKPVLETLKPGFWGYWAILRGGIPFMDIPTDTNAPGLYHYNLETGRISLIATVDKPPAIADSAFAVSPDERYILYTQVDQSGSDIMIAEAP